MTARRIAMWSGPRNISTAMMRSWGSRPDTIVCDEPFYAHYLLATRLPHPGAEEVIAHHETDPRNVIASLLAPLPAGKSIFYQKHMAHHLLPQIDRGWLGEVTNCFLLRDPVEMLLSFSRNIAHPTLSDTGLPQQVEIFEHVRRTTGRTPPVLDSKDVLEHPRRMLALLCEAVAVPFDEAMLSWPPGPRETDGIWAKHWYHAVERSTGFDPYRAKDEPLPRRLAALLDECTSFYETLSMHRLRP
jgi:hypothetical protein